MHPLPVNGMGRCKMKSGAGLKCEAVLVVGHDVNALAAVFLADERLGVAFAVVAHAAVTAAAQQYLDNVCHHEEDGGKYPQHPVGLGELGHDGSVAHHGDVGVGRPCRGQHVAQCDESG